MNYNSSVKLKIMKNSVKLMVVCLSLFSFSKVNSQTLEEELSVVYQQIDTAKTFGASMSAAAQFELIATMNSDQYAANYYAAYSKAMVSYTEKETKKRDLLLDARDFMQKSNN